jgi:hypothetical protein
MNMCESKHAANIGACCVYQYHGQEHRRIPPFFGVVYFASCTEKPAEPQTRLPG